MKPHNITYKKISKLLKSIGYEEVRKKGSHIIYSFPEYGSIVILPFLRANSMISLQLFQMIKKNIIGKGILSGEEFKNMFEYK